MNKFGSISRYTIIGGALSLAGLFIFVWMVQLQNSEAAKILLAKGDKYAYELKTFYPERGNIYDRWGHLLAGNIEVYELGADLRYVENGETIATTLSQTLGVDYKTTYDAVTLPGDNTVPRYAVLANNVTPEQIAQISTLMTKMANDRSNISDSKKLAGMPSLSGLEWYPRLKRTYPEHQLGSTIIGFYSSLDPNNARGYFGVEEKYNNLLAGSPVKVLVPNDPNKIDKPPVIPPGVSLVLTMDREIQAMTEAELDKAISDNNAVSGTIIIMDPRNGEILSMASTPRLDPNEYWKYAEVFPSPTPYNRAIGSTYEPGSVFKVLTMASAIDNGTVAPGTPFLDTGVITVGGIPIYNWDRGAWGPQDMIGCMQHSLNVCLAWVATQLGPTNFYSYLQRFGIGHLTGIDLAGEVNYPLSTAGDENWYPVNLGTNSFGQGVAVTPIQMITAISAVANNQGKMMAPHILKATIDGDKQYNNPPQVIGQPITANAAKTMTDMLYQSLEKESSVALVPGYSVAGKTGTAEIPGPGGYLSNLTNASFVGWGPVDDPRFIVYIWLEKPQSSQWGSVVAAPVFSDVVQKLVVLLDLPPDDARHQLDAGQQAVTPVPAEDTSGQ